MTSALTEFDKAIDGIRELNAIYDHLFNTLHLEPAALEILRSQIVYVVSAMDRYFHEVVRIGFLEEHKGVRIKTESFNKWSLSYKKVAEIIRYSDPSFIPTSVTETVDYVVDKDVQEKNSILAFQQPDKIKDALSLIWTEQHKMVKVARKMNFEPTKNDNECKKLLDQKIKLISIRRNEIVHEGDIDTLTGTRRTITRTVTDDYINFICDLVHAVHLLITDRSCYVTP